MSNVVKKKGTTLIKLPTRFTLTTSTFIKGLQPITFSNCAYRTQIASADDMLADRSESFESVKPAVFVLLVGFYFCQMIPAC